MTDHNGHLPSLHLAQGYGVGGVPLRPRHGGGCAGVELLHARRQHLDSLVL